MGAHVSDFARRRFVGDVPNFPTTVAITARHRFVEPRDVGLLETQFRRHRRIAGGVLGVGKRLANGRNAAAEAHKMAVVLFDVGDHEIARDPHLVGVGIGPVGWQFGDHRRRRGVGDIDEGGAVGRFHVPHKSVPVLDHDLATAWYVQTADPPDLVGNAAAFINRHRIPRRFRDRPYIVFCWRRRLRR